MCPPAGCPPQLLICPSSLYALSACLAHCLPPPLQGGCEEEHIRMGFYERELFDKMHGEDE